MENKETSPLPDSKVSLSPEVYKGRFVAVLSKTEATIQGFHNNEARLIYNEDGLPAIEKFVEKGKEALKLIEEERVKLKEPYLQESRNIDAGAKLLSSDLQSLVAKAEKKKQEIKAQLAAKALLEKEAEENKKTVLALIDNFIMDNTQLVADAHDLPTLIDIERRINLETANQSKYGDYLPLLKSRAVAIRTLLAAQKLAVKELSALQIQVSQAAENGADNVVMEGLGRIEEIKATISQNKTDIVEAGVGQATNSGYAEQVKTEMPKAARRSWAYEAIDLPLLYKKNPELVTLSLNDKAVKALLADKKEKGELKQETINGLKIYYNIKY